jgi:hypothetical protein
MSFAKLKVFRRVSTRYEKLAKIYRAAVEIIFLIQHQPIALMFTSGFRWTPKVQKRPIDMKRLYNDFMKKNDGKH